MHRNGKEFAEALFSLARESGQELAYGDGLRYVRDAFRETPEYAALLSVPTIPQREKEALLEEAFGAQIPEEVLSAVELLCRKGRIRELEDVEREYESLYRAFTAVIEAEAVSAIPLTPEQKEQLRRKLEKLTGNTVEVTYTVDPSILGGIRVTMEGRVLDGSLAGRLRELKGAIRT